MLGDQIGPAASFNPPWAVAPKGSNSPYSRWQTTRPGLVFVIPPDASAARPSSAAQEAHIHCG